jgi:hypothetical protein
VGDTGLGSAGSEVAVSIEQREVGRVAWGQSSERVGQMRPGSVGRLDRWVQVMDFWSITLSDEYRRHIYIHTLIRGSF